MNGTTRIVVADDDRAALHRLQQMLEEMGHQVVGMAGTGREVIEHCQLCEPDLVITDATMPEMNGIDACQLIRSQMEVPVIVLVEGSARDEADTCECCYRLSKPFQPRQLKRAIERALTESNVGMTSDPASNWFG